jgi:hypothetical protein
LAGLLFWTDNLMGWSNNLTGLPDNLTKPRTALTKPHIVLTEPPSPTLGECRQEETRRAEDVLGRFRVSLSRLQTVIEPIRCQKMIFRQIVHGKRCSLDHEETFFLWKFSLKIIQQKDTVNIQG